MRLLCISLILLFSTAVLAQTDTSGQQPIPWTCVAQGQCAEYGPGMTCLRQVVGDPAIDKATAEENAFEACQDLGLFGCGIDWCYQSQTQN